MANNNDSYDELFAKLSSNKSVSFSNQEAEVKNNGEIYFSPNSGATRPVERPSTYQTSKSRSSSQTSTSTRTSGGTSTKTVTRSPSSSATNSTNKKSSKKKKNRKKKKLKLGAALARILVTIAVIVVLAFFIKMPFMSCVNDILALDGSVVEHRVTVTETLEYDEVIDLLYEKNLIEHPLFCKFVAKFMGFDDPDYCYAPGDYDLSTSMGVEGMLQEIAHAGNVSSTVTITFPEGYTVDKIAEKLELNGVCSRKGFIAAVSSDTIYEEYEILKNIDRTDRYYGVEGYLYPDTYEFYVGEDPYSVVGRFINNFTEKWTEEYESRAAALGYSMDEIITIASILEKEAKDSEQMSLISSILYNRLDAPGYYPFINCDSTKAYIEGSKDIIDNDERYELLISKYDTYTVQGLPAGPISNPGANAIYAALHPDNTSYYYFLHDKEGRIYVARTESEHEANGAYIN